jgi:pre-mRNA-processing factor 19
MRIAHGFLCHAVSGQVPEQPVVSKNSGHLFEKRLIEKYIATEGKCPVTKEELTVDDLMELQSKLLVEIASNPVDAHFVM